MRPPRPEPNRRVLASAMLISLTVALPACTNHGREFHPECVLGVAALIGIGMVAPCAFDDSPPPTYEQQVAEFYGDHGSRRR